MEHNDVARANRFEGRLFSSEGRLHLVLDVDVESGVARVSCGGDGSTRVRRMPIAEIALRLSGRLLLDDLYGADTYARIQQRPDGWFFRARDGMHGPYASEDAAGAALRDHIMAAQGRAELP